MRILIKEYKVGQIPVEGEYAIYKSGGKFFFAVGNGCTPIENLASGLEISEETFLSFKKTYEEFSSEKDLSSSSDEEKVDDKLYLVTFQSEEEKLTAKTVHEYHEVLRLFVGRVVRTEEFNYAVFVSTYSDRRALIDGAKFIGEHIEQDRKEVSQKVEEYSSQEGWLMQISDSLGNKIDMLMSMAD